MMTGRRNLVFLGVYFGTGESESVGRLCGRCLDMQRPGITVDYMLWREQPLLLWDVLREDRLREISEPEARCRGKIS